MNDILKNTFDSKYALYTGSGTTALYMCLNYLKKQGLKSILMPTIICPQVPIVAKKVGLEIVFCDVSLEHYNLDLKFVKQAYERVHFDILLLSHIYGYTCDDGIVDFCKQNGIIVVEDAAQTYKINNRCDFNILSFGHTKFFENNNLGGGLFSNHIKLDLDFKYRFLPQDVLYKQKDFNLYKNNFDEYRKRFYDLDKDDKDYYKLLYELLLIHTVFLDDDLYNDLLVEKLNHIQDLCDLRQKNSLLYVEKLQHRLILHPKLSQQDIPWRYTFRFLGDRELFLARLREKGVDCSSWYDGCDKIFYVNKKLQNTRILEKQIVNLWVDKPYDMTHKQIDIINDILNKYF